MAMTFRDMVRDGRDGGEWEFDGLVIMETG